jgi:hypothetical protein
MTQMTKSSVEELPTAEDLQPWVGTGVTGGAVEPEESSQCDEDLAQHSGDRAHRPFVDVLPSEVDLTQ